NALSWYTGFGDSYYARGDEVFAWGARPGSINDTSGVSLKFARSSRDVLMADAWARYPLKPPVQSPPPPPALVLADKNAVRGGVRGRGANGVGAAADVSMLRSETLAGVGQELVATGKMVAAAANIPGMPNPTMALLEKNPKYYIPGYSDYMLWKGMSDNIGG